MTNDRRTVAPSIPMPAAVDRGTRARNALTKQVGDSVPTSRGEGPSAVRTVGRWMVSFLGFPIGGFIAALLFGHLDSTPSALMGGVVAGAVIGAAQAWAFGHRGPNPLAWTGATAVGLAAGLAVGAGAVDYATDLNSLLVQGGVSGAAVGLAQSLVVVRRFGARALVWPPMLAAMWTLGWQVTDAVIGSNADQHFYVFGAGGALAVTTLTLGLPLALTREGTGPSWTTGTSSHRAAS